MKRYNVLIVIFGALLFAATGYADVIDTFSTAQAGISEIAVGSYGPDIISCSDCVGGSRQLDLQILSNGSTTQIVEIGASDGVLNYSNPTQAQSIGKITWNANGAGLNADLLASGNTRIAVNVIETDLGGTIRFDVTNELAAVAFSEINLPPLSHGLFYFPYVGFSDPTVFNNLIDSIVMTLSGPASLDLTIDIVETQVPEPSTLILIGGGLLGVCLWGKRKR